MPPIATSALLESRNGTNSASSKAELASSEPENVQSMSRFHCSSTAETIELEEKYAAHNYHPLPVVFARASGCYVWDPEGKKYLDFLSAYSALNQGHCHPELIKVLTEQASVLALSSRAFYNNVFPRFAEYCTKLLGFDMILPMNTGAEAVETAIKVARKWGYKVKGIPSNQSIVFSVQENFHGRTFSAITMSTDPESRDNYGPYLPNLGPVCPATNKVLRYNNIDDLETAFKAHGDRAAGIILEPIQGEAGIKLPDDDYLPSIRALCDKYNVLMICDEVQTGIARTGKMLCHEWSNIKPDLVCVGKAISGGMYPVSAVLGSRDILLTVEPGTHGSTYGGNPLGSAVAQRALELIVEGNMVERAGILGQRLRDALMAIKSPLIKAVRGKGLLNAIEVDESQLQGHSAWDLCLLMKDKGLLAKPTHETIIRLAPPLIITESEIDWAVQIIADTLEEARRWKEDKTQL